MMRSPEVSSHVRGSRALTDRQAGQAALLRVSRRGELGERNESLRDADGGRSTRVACARLRASAETRLLLWCARSRTDAATVAEVTSLLDQDLDWDYLLRMADLNEVTPLLHRSLKGSHPDVVPTPIYDRLEAQFYDNVARNVHLTSTLLELLNLFAAHGISVVPLKGPVLAAAAYGELSLRQFRDLDILVRRQDIGSAEALIAHHGFRRRLDLTGLRATAYRHSETAYDFVSEDGRVTVELHWELMPRYFSFPLGLERARRRLEPVTLLGSTVSSLAVEDLLLYLCIHGTKHRWERMKWVCDVAELLHARRDLNWTTVIERASRMGLERMLALGLALASGLLDAPVPDQVHSRMRTDPSVDELALDAFRRMFSVTDSRPAQDNLFYLRAMQSPWRRLRYAVHVLMVPTIEDLESISLSGPLALLYYPLRPLRLLGQALRLAWRPQRC